MDERYAISRYEQAALLLPALESLLLPPQAVREAAIRAAMVTAKTLFFIITLLFSLCTKMHNYKNLNV